jgi:acid phosphatase (class A)
MLHRLSRDVRPAIAGPKRLYDRKRPYQVDRGAICAKSGMIVALTPGLSVRPHHLGLDRRPGAGQGPAERADALLARAKAYGESRVVCGVHNATSVEAGRINAAALVDALSASPAFEADVAAVGRELDAARAAGRRPIQPGARPKRP